MLAGVGLQAAAFSLAQFIGARLLSGDSAQLDPHATLNDIVFSRPWARILRQHCSFVDHRTCLSHAGEL